MDEISIIIIFPRIETIIHGDLYSYGLTASFEWINPIRDSSYLFSNCLILAAVFMALSGLTLLIFNTKRNNFLKAASAFLVAVGAGLNLFSLYPIYQRDQIVNRDLYLFGLQFSDGWHTNYELYNMQLHLFILFASAMAVASVVLISISERKDGNFGAGSLINSVLIVSGTASLAFSILYTSSILALVGLGLVFWGVAFAYVSNEKYVKKILLDTSINSQLEAANKSIQDADLAGNAIFLPPRYFKIPETYKTYVSKNKNSKLPAPEIFYRRDPRLFIEFIQDPPAILITPPGAELVALFEKELKTDFLRVDLDYVQVNIPKLLTENLEIAEDCEIEFEENTIRARIDSSTYREATPDEKELDKYFSFASPLISAIACVLAKVSGKPVMEVKRQTKADGEVVVEYRILEREE